MVRLKDDHSRAGISPSHVIAPTVGYLFTVTTAIAPKGGLGNQLFIYSAGFSISQSLGQQLVVDMVNYRRTSGPCFELDSFEAEYLLMEPSPIQRVSAFVSWVGAGIASRASIQWARIGLPSFPNRASVFRELNLSRRRRIRLRGYFQSWKYFAESSEEIRSQLRRIRNPSDWFLKKLMEVRDCQRSVAVHVRRGDYLTNEYMGIIPEDYYDSALAIIARQTPDLEIFLFSDDKSLLEDPTFLARWRSRIRVVNPESESRPIESLVLISECHNVVMANSSFSWWGAWLGEREGRTVIYPRPWLRQASVTDRDLCLPSWISLGFTESQDLSHNPQTKQSPGIF